MLAPSSHPKSLWILSFSKLWDTFSYFGTQTLLVLYFIHIFNYTESASYLLYGAYAACSYALPIVGGIVTDKYLGSKNAFIIGSSLTIVGNLILMCSSAYLFCLGLATSLIGAGLYRGTSTHLVGSLYKDGDIRKEGGFTWLYLATNVGGMLGPLVYGLIAHFMGWNIGFLFSAIGLLFSTLWFISNGFLWNEEKKAHITGFFLKNVFCILIILACLLLSLPFYFYHLINPFIFLLFTFGIIYLISTILIKYKNQERRRLFTLLILSAFGMFYFATGLQIGTTITLFIQHDIQEQLIKTSLPASTFSALYPLAVLLLAPLFTSIWYYLKKQGICLNAAAKIIIGMLFAALGIIAFAIASSTSFIWTGILLGNLFLGAGELTLVPAVYTAISDLAPQGIKNTMMGCWFFFIALGGYLSGVLAHFSSQINIASLSNRSPYFDGFLFIACFSLIVALVLGIFTPALSKMMRQ